MGRTGDISVTDATWVYLDLVAFKIPEKEVLLRRGASEAVHINQVAIDTSNLSYVHAALQWYALGTIRFEGGSLRIDRFNPESGGHRREAYILCVFLEGNNDPVIKMNLSQKVVVSLADFLANRTE